MPNALLVLLVLLSSAISALAQSAGAAGSGWPTARAGQSRTGAVASEGMPPYTLLWSRSTAALTAADPLVAFGRVYLTDASSRVAVFDLATGRAVWSDAAGAGTAELQVRDAASGKLRWSRTLSGQIVRAPQVDQAEGYVATGDGSVTAVHQPDGAIRWTAKVATPVTPASSDGRLVVVGAGKGAEGFSAADGSPVFTVRLTESLAFVPVVAAAGVYLPLAESVVTVDRKGKKLWTARMAKPLAAPVAVSASGVIVPCVDGSISALDSRQGRPMWEALIAGTPTALVSAGAVVYVGTRQGGLTGLRLTDGASVWSVNIGKGAITGLAAADGKVIVVAGEWAMALRPAPTAPDEVALTTASGAVHLAWSEGTANGIPITGYRVWRRRGTAWGLAGVAGTVTRFFDEAPLPGDVAYAVTAIAQDGAESLRSADAVHVAADPLLLNVAASPQPYDSRHGALVVSFGLRTAARVTWHVVDAANVALTNDQSVFLPQGPGSIAWDGRDRNGRIVDPGACRVRLVAEAEGATDSAARIVAVAWGLGGAGGGGIGGTAGGAGEPGAGTGPVAGVGTPAAGGGSGSPAAGDPHDNGQHDGANPNSFTIDHHDQGHHGR